MMKIQMIKPDWKCYANAARCVKPFRFNFLYDYYLNRLLIFYIKIVIPKGR